MKKIIKGKEPKELTAYRSSIPKTDMEKPNIYENYSDAGILRKQLLEEQGYICCYCMGRIEERTSKIEHFKAQSKDRTLQINYTNLFIACKGGEGMSTQYCDTAKGNKALETINFFSNVKESIKYCKNGTISSKESSQMHKSALTDEINSILNLNTKTLVNNRKQTYNDFKKRGKWSKSHLEKTISHYKSKHNGKYEPYAEMMVYLLSKKLQGK